VVTGREAGENRDAAMRRGAAAYLVKPVDRLDLAGAIQRVTVRGAYPQAA